MFSPIISCHNHSLAYAEFSKGGRGPGNLIIMKTRRKISPLRISPVFGPKLGEEQKKKVLTQILSVSVLKLSAQVTKGLAMPQFCILFYANYTILATQREGMAPCPHPKYAPVITNEVPVTFGNDS